MSEAKLKNIKIKMDAQKPKKVEIKTMNYLIGHNNDEVRNCYVEEVINDDVVHIRNVTMIL